jgi:hypothetical protein
LKVDTGITNKTVGMAATSQDNFNGNFSISKPAAAPPTPAPTPTPAPVETKTDTATKKDTTTKTVVATTLPTELKDVKAFQTWLDKNKPGWHDKYNTLGDDPAKGYGKFGPRTSKAWSTYKDEYLKGTNTPTVTPTGNPDLEVDDKDASFDQPF